jgi:hypothetical protein
VIKVNRKMQNILITNNLIKATELEYITVHNIPNIQVIEVNGCILIDEGSISRDTLDIKRIIDIYFDRTGFEAYHNHIHIGNYLDKELKNSGEELLLAFKAINILGKLLVNRFPQYKFHIVLSFDGNQAILRFYRLREDENCWINITNLDGYQDEAVLVKEICGI